MAYLHHPDETPTPLTDELTNQLEIMGAQAPTLDFRPMPRPAAKIEPFRPANATRLHIRPDARLVAAATAYAANTGLTLTHVIELAVHAYLTKHDRTALALGAQAPQIDRLTTEEIKEHSSIREIYWFWTAAFNQKSSFTDRPWRQVWTDRDNMTAVRVRHHKLQIIELAILYCLLRLDVGKKRIGTFGYYEQEIHQQAEDAADISPATLDSLLNVRREQLADRLRIKPPTF